MLSTKADHTSVSNDRVCAVADSMSYGRRQYRAESLMSSHHCRTCIYRSVGETQDAQMVEGCVDTRNECCQTQTFGPLGSLQRSLFLAGGANVSVISQLMIDKKIKQTNGCIAEIQRSGLHYCDMIEKSKLGVLLDNAKRCKIVEDIEYLIEA